MVNHVRFGTVIAYICGNVIENLLHYGQNR